MISLDQAADRGIARVRSPNWPAGGCGHLAIDIYVFACRGILGPRMRYWSPGNLARHGRDPIVLEVGSTAKRCYLPYTGPLPGSARYQHEVDLCGKLFSLVQR